MAHLDVCHTLPAVLDATERLAAQFGAKVIGIVACQGSSNRRRRNLIRSETTPDRPSSRNLLSIGNCHYVECQCYH